MGIRQKILFAFILSFGLMAFISLTLLQRSVNKSYESIERREMIGRIGRVLSSFETTLSGLNNLTRDWAQWTEMYEYARVPAGKDEWVKNNLAAESLQSNDVSVIWIFGANKELLYKVTENPAGPHIMLTPFLEKYKQSIFENNSRKRNCGLLRTELGLVGLCWARIVRSDFSGDEAGTLIMGLLMSPERLEKLRNVADIPFALDITPDMPEKLTFWPDTLKPSSLGGTGFWSEHDSTEYHLYYTLQDVSRHDVGLISLKVPRELYAQGMSLYAQVRRQLLWTAVGMALLLGFILHGLLVSRLRTFTRQLLNLMRNSSWQERIGISGQDELGLLAGEVNKMLCLIEEQMDNLTALSLSDPLTGLPNRRAFDARLTVELSRERRTPNGLALLILDVDFFKPYNDCYGHPAGDIALQAVADVMRQACLRASDLPARIGGEEFTVLLPETDEEGAIEIAERIRQLLRERNIAHKESAAASWVTVSIGIALAKDESPESLMARADEALYCAKEQGRNRAYCAER